MRECEYLMEMEGRLAYQHALPFPPSDLYKDCLICWPMGLETALQVRGRAQRADASSDCPFRPTDGTICGRLSADLNVLAEFTFLSPSDRFYIRA